MDSKAGANVERVLPGLKKRMNLHGTNYFIA